MVKSFRNSRVANACRKCVQPPRSLKNSGTFTFTYKQRIAPSFLSQFWSHCAMLPFALKAFTYPHILHIIQNKPCRCFNLSSYPALLFSSLAYFLANLVAQSCVLKTSRWFPYCFPWEKFQASKLHAKRLSPKNWWPLIRNRRERRNACVRMSWRDRDRERPAVVPSQKSQTVYFHPTSLYRRPLCSILWSKGKKSWNWDRACIDLFFLYPEKSSSDPSHGDLWNIIGKGVNVFHTHEINWRPFTSL